MPAVASYLLDYARYHGLATDHRALDLDWSAHLDIAADDTPDPSPSKPPLVPPSVQPKLKLKKSELQRLATNLQPPPRPSWDDILPDRHRIRDLKLEIPLLVADHEEDLRCFTGRPSIDLDDLGIFPEDNNSEQSKQWDTKMAQRKLKVTKEDIMYLQEILRDPYSPESYEQLVRDALPRYTRVRMIKSLEDEEMELEEDKTLQESQQPLESPARPTSKRVLPSTSPAFSATRSLLSFMSTRGDKRLVPTSSHPSAAAVTKGGTV